MFISGHTTRVASQTSNEVKIGKVGVAPGKSHWKGTQHKREREKNDLMSKKFDDPLQDVYLLFKICLILKDVRNEHR